MGPWGIPEALAPPEDGEWELVVAGVKGWADEVEEVVAEEEVLADEAVAARVDFLAGDDFRAGDEVGLPVAVDELDEPEPQPASNSAIRTMPPTSGR